MRRQVTECFQLIEDDGGGWLVVEQLHASRGENTPMSWSFATREQAEHHLREARTAHRAGFGCGLGEGVQRPPRRRPVSGERLGGR